MTTPAITVEARPAGHGDCLLISCQVGPRTWKLPIDAGPDECLPTLVDRVKAVSPNAQDTRRTDLAVISHIDHHHIGGAAGLFADKTLNLEFGGAGSTHRADRAHGVVGEWVGLAAVFAAAARGLRWNLAFGGVALAAYASGHPETVGHCQGPHGDEKDAAEDEELGDGHRENLPGRLGGWSRPARRGRK